MAQYALGLDFGTNSVRALIVDCADGNEVGLGVSAYASGDEGVLYDASDHHLARQNPADYAPALQEAVLEATRQAGQTGFTLDSLVGIGIDTTGSTPIPVSEDGIPLGMQEQFEKDLAAMAWLWKDHTSHREAAEITANALELGKPYLAKCGGAYFSEWLWSKALHCARTAPHVFDAAHSWMEFCDCIPGLLTELGTSVPRSICAAGHKGMYSDSWGGLPDKEFLASIDSRLGALRERMFDKAYPSDHRAGNLTRDWAEMLELKEGIPIAVGLLDAHAGAIGSGIASGRMVKIIGTSTCDILVGSHVPDIPGVSGVVEGSVIPGMTGIEAGQSAVGDIFAWWSRVCGRSQEELTEDAEQLRPGESGLIALDWNNGNRNVLADPLLTGLLVGQTLHTTAAEIYRALIEATAFGALVIINRIQEHGVKIEELVACGGIAEKSPFAMQIYADVLNRPIRLSKSAQAPALGAAIFGAVVGGAYTDVSSAQKAMTGFKDVEYAPNPNAAATYKRLFAVYEQMCTVFGESKSPSAMKELIKIRNEANA